MVGMWSLFREIDQSKTTWAFKARAIHVYREPAHDCFPESLEIVFHDEEGSKMHAHIPDQYINTFIGIFKEGRVFAVKNIMVEENYMFFKTTTSAYRLCFFNKSAAFEIKGVPFLSRTFSLVSFASLQALDTIDEQYRIVEETPIRSIFRLIWMINRMVSTGCMGKPWPSTTLRIGLTFHALVVTGRFHPMVIAFGARLAVLMMQFSGTRSM
ncbi:unnamed protein product [Cuscuta europaea]|uniref:Replication protein A 70 kDa DNA-binding subunit B/D first OB fold domain-containing protein n=1 Tax=Cuscuta europaea TaxID=41803 RepID=A0A9P0ZXK5_CUSEU|nr:unnamed protein product [Cuscuta europaea]